MSYLGFLFISIPVAAQIALITLIFAGDPVSAFVWAWGIMAFLGGLAALFGRSDAEDLNDSADINEVAFQIRSVFGREAQAEFLAEVSRPNEPGKNTNEVRFAPGHNRRTIAEKAREIRGKYKPISEWKENFGNFG